MPLDRPRPKTAKRMMEKKRRARINDSLTELKNLVLNAMKKDNSRQSKLEKADILEMTVRYLRGEHRNTLTDDTPSTSSSGGPADLSQYRTGFAACMKEVSRYFEQHDDVQPFLKQKLINHLAGLCKTEINPGNRVSTFPVIPMVYQAQVSRHSESSQSNLHVQSSSSMQVNINPPHSTAPSIPFPFQRPGAFTPTHVPSADADDKSSIPSNRSTVKPVSVETASGTKTNLITQPLVIKPPETQSEPHGTHSVHAPSIGANDITLVLSQPVISGGQIPIQFIPVYHPSPLIPSMTTSRLGESHPQFSSHQTATISTSNAILQSPRAGTLAPTAVAVCARQPVAQTTGSVGAVVTPAAGGVASVMPIQGQPLTITFPVNARIVPNAPPERHVSIVPIPTATISPLIPSTDNSPALPRVSLSNHATDARPKRPWED